MDNQGKRPGWWKWPITPPQSYAFYLAALVLIFVLSFYAGTQKPKGSPGMGSPPAAQR
jgi:hypothetical protein